LGVSRNLPIVDNLQVLPGGFSERATEHRQVVVDCHFSLRNLALETARRGARLTAEGNTGRVAWQQPVDAPHEPHVTATPHSTAFAAPSERARSSTIVDNLQSTVK
jgi:hypothetical protein